MILDKNDVYIKLNSITTKHYNKLGYIGKMNDIILVKIEHLTDGCNIKLLVECDICGLQKMLKYSNYKKGIKKFGIYACNKKECRYEKYKRTCYDRYGVDNPSKLEITSVKRKKTNLERYGVEFNFQISDFKEKSKTTNLERYGVDNAMNSEVVKNKIKTTNLERYGVSNTFLYKPFKEKAIETSLKRYGTKYGSSPEANEKRRNTHKNRYGVEYAMQNQELFNKQRKSALIIKQYDKYTYQGTYELDFIKFCISNNIEFNNANFRVEYYNNDKIHYYYPDFFIEKLNLIIEIKSLYTYEKELNQNLLKKDSCLNNGFNYLFIINKNYTELLEKYYNF